MRKFMQIANEDQTDCVVFLGGTCADSKWRERFIPMLESVPYFNPVVENWTEECITIEDEAKEIAKVLLFVITPFQLGFYSIAELTVAAMEGKKDVVLVFSEENEITFKEHQVKSNNAIIKLLTEKTKVNVFNSMEDAANYINGKYSMSAT